MILVFLGAAATIYLTAVLLNRQTELELRKEGQVLLFQQKHDTYMRVIEKVAEIVERERHDFALIDEPGSSATSLPLSAARQLSKRSDAFLICLLMDLRMAS